MNALVRRAAPWLPAIAYMALIAWLSSQPGLPMPLLPGLPWQDKFWHLVEYTALGLLMAHALDRSLREPTAWNVVIRAVPLTTLWGYLDEIHQAFVPGRTPDRFDLLADLCGAILGTIVYVAVTRTLRFVLRSRA